MSSTLVSFRMPDYLRRELLERVEAERQRTGYPITTTDMLIKIIREYFKEHPMDALDGQKSEQK